MDYRITRLRCFAIIVVVFGHSIILYDPNWGMYSTKYEVTSLMYIKHIINTFQMPLFLFISGVCFYYSVKKHKYINRQSILNGIVGKSKRLLIPFVFIALFWMIPIRIICRYTSWNNLNFMQIFTRVFLGKDSGHLWFLPTLFLIFVISFAILPRINKKLFDILILIIALCLSVMSHMIPAILFLNNTASSLYWFILGYEFCKYYKYNWMFKYSRTRWWMLAFSILIILFVVIWGRSDLFAKFSEIVAVTFLLLSAYMCTSSRKCSAVCQLISDKSMGVYLIHSPLIYFTYSYLANISPSCVVLINFFACGFVALILTCHLSESKEKWLIGY